MLKAIRSHEAPRHRVTGQERELGKQVSPIGCPEWTTGPKQKLQTKIANVNCKAISMKENVTL
jgi:hypothetical protein